MSTKKSNESIYKGSLNKDEAVKKIISYMLFYDKEEIEIFLETFTNNVNNNGYTIDSTFETIIKSFRDLLFEEPELLSEKSSGNRIDDIKNALLKKIPFNTKVKNGVKSSETLLENGVMRAKNMSSSENMMDAFLLGSECADYYLWECFKDTVDNIDRSSIPFKEKLTIKLPDVKDGKSKIYKLSDVNAKTYFEDSKYTIGINELDEYINVQPTNVIYFAARPSVGKSMAVVNMALQNALRGIPSLYVSLEMNMQQTKGRILTWVKQGDIEREEEIIELEKSDLYKKVVDQFYVLDADSLNGNIICKHIEDFLSENEGGIVILDSANLVRYTGKDEWASLREISRSLKKIGLKYKAVMVSCIQASRESEMGGLSLSTLFGSSTLEQDADIVIGMEQEGKTPMAMSPLKISIMKNRDGIRNIDFKIRLDKSCMRFHDKSGMN